MTELHQCHSVYFGSVCERLRYVFRSVVQTEKLSPRSHFTIGTSYFRRRDGHEQRERHIRTIDIAKSHHEAFIRWPSEKQSSPKHQTPWLAILSWDKHDRKDARVILYPMQRGMIYPLYDRLYQNTMGKQEICGTYHQISIARTRCHPQ